MKHLGGAVLLSKFRLVSQQVEILIVLDRNQAAAVLVAVETGHLLVCKLDVGHGYGRIYSSLIQSAFATG